MRIGRKKQEVIPAILYKYYSAERSGVFSSFLVRYSQLRALNDPFEFLVDAKRGVLRKGAAQIARQATSPLSLVRMAINQSAATLKADARMRELPWLGRASARLIFFPVMILFTLLVSPFFRRSMLAIAEAAAKEFEELIIEESRRGLILVFSCSETWDSVPMWAHYAGNHSGFAIGIDPAKAFSAKRPKDNKTHILPRKVQYQDQIPTISPGSMEVADFMVAKMSHWSYEREWRFTEIADDADVRGDFVDGCEVLLFRLEPSSIKEVIFGAKCHISLIESVKALLQEQGLSPDLYKARRGNGYGFERVLLDDTTDDEDTDPMPLPTLKDRRYEHMERALDKVAKAAERHRLLRGKSPFDREMWQ